jgi:hypothetical protein
MGVKMHRLRALVAQASVVATAITSPSADALDLSPGLYRVEVRIILPNVQDAAAPTVLNRCVTLADLESGRAFFVVSDNPLKSCELLDYQAAGNTAMYRIACPGPNRGSAVGSFEVTEAGYRGTITMNMGGKNMTMSEAQLAKRIGTCQ